MKPSGPGDFFFLSFWPMDSIFKNGYRTVQIICFIFIEFWWCVGLFFFSIFSFLFLFFVFCFLGSHSWHMEVPRPQVSWSYSFWPMPQPQQPRIQATSAIYTAAHSNDGSLSHWSRPGLEPMSSWILERFITDELQRNSNLRNLNSLVLRKNFQADLQIHLPLIIAIKSALG